MMTCTKQILRTLILIATLSISMVSSIDLLPYGKTNGDTVIIDSSTGFSSLTNGNTDEGIKIIDIPNTPFFKKQRNTKLQLSTNGYVVFGNDRSLNSGIPTDFPISQNGYLISIIAVFWTDFKFLINSKFLYQIYTSGKTLTTVENIILTRYPEEKFTPTHALVVTWADVRHDSKPDSESFTFQLVLTSNGKATYVILLYKTLPSGVKATVGFQENMNLYRYEYSMEPSIAYQLLRSSNVKTNGVRVYRVTEEVLDCSGLSNGPHEHPSDREKFFVCHHSVVTEIKICNSSQHFDPEIKFCVPAADYPCNQEMVQNCKGKGEGAFPHKTDCSKIVHCRFDKIIKITTCPYGTVFHPDLKVCVFESQYKCNEAPSGGPPERSFCNDKADGNYKDPNSCNHFIQCSNGLFHKTACPAGLNFKQSGPPGFGHCDWPFNVPCSI